MGTNLINKIKELSLPDGHFIVCGGSLLEVLGIRKAEDIDLLVSPELFSELRDTQGWLKHKKYDTAIVHPENKAEAKQSLDFMKENYTLADLLPTVYIKDGIPFMSLEVLQNAKTQLGREKDTRDLQMIQEYLAKSVVAKGE